MFVARGLAASGTAVIAFFMAAVLPSATWPLIDGDVWWHLRAGEEILVTGAIPRVDEWSILGFGRPWVSLLTQYAAVISVETDPQAELDRYEIDHMVFQPDSDFGAWLDASPSWQRAYADPLAVVWVRDQ